MDCIYIEIKVMKYGHLIFYVSCILNEIPDLFFLPVLIDSSDYFLKYL